MSAPAADGRGGALGVVAGGGALPVIVAEHLRSAGEPYFILRLDGLTDPALADHPGADVRLGAMGGIVKAAREAGCTRLALAGQVARPDFSQLRPDWRGAQALPRLVAAARKGDDALLRAAVAELERDGFEIVGVDSIVDGLRAPAGAIGARAPDAAAMADIDKARGVVAAMGAFDIGQGAVVCDGLVLAVEAAEGTDAMLARVAELPAALRGAAGARRGVMVKAPKPAQERRVDLPTIGVRTMDGAAHAGLAGVAVQAGACLVLDRPAVIAAADAAGLFLYGFQADTPDGR